MGCTLTVAGVCFTLEWEVKRDQSRTITPTESFTLAVCCGVQGTLDFKSTLRSAILRLVAPRSPASVAPLSPFILCTDQTVKLFPAPPIYRNLISAPLPRAYVEDLVLKDHCEEFLGQLVIDRLKKRVLLQCPSSVTKLDVDDGQIVVSLSEIRFK